MADHMKKTCALCPFSRTKTLALHPERAADFAYMAQNPYSSFPCHKTAELDEDDPESSEYVWGESSKMCHGFLTLQRAENGIEDDEFQPDGDGFECTHEMIEHHEELWDADMKRRKSA
jgi:hypothetical protein